MSRVSAERSFTWLRRARRLLLVHLTPVTLCAVSVTAQEPAPAPIADNSFLIEEAYNQEAGVVQHIGTFARPDGGGEWSFSFTQEWPLRGVQHQLSFTVPLSYAEGSGTGLNDVGLNNRYQLEGASGGPLAVAPRLTALIPTGSEADGRGAGSLGMQANLPVSYRAGSWLATHWNAGFTVAPEAAPAYTLGASAVWLLRPTLNLLVEALWSVSGGEEVTLLNPGVRWAHDFSSGLQIVPGLAYTLDLGPGSDGDGLFLYLSFEHPFKR